MKSSDPFFIVGFQRSGTTLLRLMLDSHPELAIPLDPVGLWIRYAARLDDYGDLSATANRISLVDDILAEERIRLWEVPFTRDEVLQNWSGPTYPGLIEAMYRSYARARGKRFWGDKDPGNMVRIHTLVDWFPGARIIHIIRDGRDACLSHLGQDFGFDNVLECASAWREEVQWVRRIGRLLGTKQYHEVRYEDLIGEPEQSLRATCRFLEVEFSEEMLHYHEHISESIPEAKRHIWPLLSQPPIASNAGRWKQTMSHGQRVCFEKRAREVLADSGYEVLPGVPSGAYLEELRNIAVSAWKALRYRIIKRSPASP